MTSATEHAAGLARTIAVANGKGGAYKTSVTSGLGGLAAAAGMRVLLVDLDHQGNLVDDLGLRESSDSGAALHAAIMGEGAALTPRPTGRDNLEIIYGGIGVEPFAGLPYTADPDEWPYRLADALAPLEAGYDLILLDCPPGDRGTLTLAYVAARYVLIPTKADVSSRRGMRDGVARRFLDARAYNPDLTLLGVVIAGIGKASTRIRRETLTAVRTELADLGGQAPAFQSVIRHLDSGHELRESGRLPHEMETDMLEQRGRILQSLKRRIPLPPGTRLSQSFTGLAEDYAGLAQEVLTAIEAHETTTGDPS